MAHDCRALSNLSNASVQIPAHIAPIVRRHVEDAAFYWQQLDGSLTSVSLKANHTLHFAKLLAAHLQGLTVAADMGCELSLAALRRWKKPGEAFAAMFVALSRTEPDLRAMVMQTVMLNSELMSRGVVAALAWAPEADAQRYVAEALASKQPLELVVALRACALRGWVGKRAPSAMDWQLQTAHEDANVRAAACRCASQDGMARLQRLVEDAAPIVRAEAAIAMGQMFSVSTGGRQWMLQAAPTLWACVASQSQVAVAATGWNKVQAERRLTRWLRHLAWVVPVGHADVAQLTAYLPLRAALSFVLHHGDMSQLPFVIQAMQDPQQSRWAGWVWQSLTGVELGQSGLALPEPPVKIDAPLTRIRRDADQGMVLPNTQAIAAHPANQSHAVAAKGQRPRFLLGQPIAAGHLLTLLNPAKDAPQALRAVAAHALGYTHPGAELSLRAKASVQTEQLRRLQAMMA
jgi:hypothetical protein